MSNVIIGIIGVILFIGLAIAGSVYLGDGVLDARASTRAATVVGGIQQVAAGVKIYQTRNRALMPNTGDTSAFLINARVLKMAPVNPLMPSNAPYTTDAVGVRNSSRVAWVIMDLGQSEEALRACGEIERSFGNKDRLAVLTTPLAFTSRANGQRRGGCHRNMPSNNYVSYVQVA